MFLQDKIFNTEAKIGFAMLASKINEENIERTWMAFEGATVQQKLQRRTIQEKIIQLS